MGRSCRKNGRYKTGKERRFPKSTGEKKVRKTETAMVDWIKRHRKSERRVKKNNL